ncbi:MAG: MMPL family transporter [Planctomycetes bacterium]|nr:MMPL family transporter [Planctomycetota bacterium]
MNVFQRVLERGWWAILAIALAGAVWSGLLLPDFRVEFGTDVLLNESDPDLAFYNQTRGEWGDDEYLLACAHREEGWFTKDGLELLCGFARDLKGIPFARSIDAITTVPLLRNSPAGILNRPRLADEKGFLNPKIDLEKAREELLQHTQALGNIVSADGKDISIVVYLDAPPEVLALDKERRALLGKPGDAAARKRLKEIAPEYEKAKLEMSRRRTDLVQAARQVSARWEGRIGKVRLSGLPIINVGLLEHIRSDISNFGVLALGVFSLAFLVIYRKLRWLVLPMICCMLPVAFMLATMAAKNQAMTIVTSNMPVLLFVLMLPYSVYFIERTNERRRLFPTESAATTAARAAAEIWSPCLYSVLATMVGTAAHIGSGIFPVKTFGIMMTFGTGLGLAVVMLLLPASTAVIRPLVHPPIDPSHTRRGILRPITGLVLHAPVPVVLFSLAIFGASILFALRIKVETKFIDYFWPRSEVYQGLDYIDNHLGGTTPIEVFLRSDKPGYFRSAEGLEALAAVAKYFNEQPATGNVRSLKTLVDEVRKAMPKQKLEKVADMVANLAPDQYSPLCNKDATQARVLVRVRETSPLLNRAKLISGLRERLESLKAGPLKGIETQVTGVCLLYSNMLNGLIKTMQETFAIALVSIWFMLLFLFRSPIMATIVLLPQILPVFLVLGVMGLTGIPLDMVTVIIASVAMGIGIDAAIQYAFRFRTELAACGGDIPEAVRRSHATIGRAILIATSIVFAGFCMLMLSHFVPTFYFGMFTGLAILMGLFASLTTLPAMFVLFNYPRVKPGTLPAADGHSGAPTA